LLLKQKPELILKRREAQFVEFYIWNIPTKQTEIISKWFPPPLPPLPPPCAHLLFALLLFIHADTVHVFSVASGHLYERFLRIMMLTVVKRTTGPVKFWILSNFLSPKFKVGDEENHKQKPSTIVNLRIELHSLYGQSL
jgi:hypothetical protein